MKRTTKEILSLALFLAMGIAVGETIRRLQWLLQ